MNGLVNLILYTPTDWPKCALWLQTLERRLRAGGHTVWVRGAPHALHHDSLREVLANLTHSIDYARDRAEGDLRYLAIWDWDTMPLAIDWADRILPRFERDPKLAVIGAHHGWVHIPGASPDTIVRFGSEDWARNYMPIPDNCAAWWVVLNLDRIERAGIGLADLDWCPDGFRFEYGVFSDGRRRVVRAVGGDTGCRIVPLLRAHGLRAELLPVAPYRGWRYGAHVSIEDETLAGADEPPSRRPIVFHHFFGRHFGSDDIFSVCHHLLDARDITASADRWLGGFLKENALWGWNHA